MSRNRISEINTGSMADIAFLLLIFFLVATTMDVDQGLLRKLPAESGDSIQRKKRNTLNVLINRENQLMVRNEEIGLKDLRKITKEFIENCNDDENLPQREIIHAKYFGDIPVTKKHIISLQTDRGTAYEMYIAVQNELVGAYNDLRNDLAMEKWGIHYELLPEEQKKAVEEIYPLRISEAEPNLSR